MILTTEVREALERYRKNDADENAKEELADEMLRLFPPNYHDEITPERLVESGFSGHWYEGKGFSIDYYPRQQTAWCVYVDRKCAYSASAEFGPRNMGDVLELVQRCKEGM
jgi:hypothetical protein